MASSGASADTVFLSFLGSDTARGLADVLGHALRDLRIYVFHGDEDVRREEVFNEHVLRGIQESRILVPILSRDYPSSQWCLRELTAMVEYVKGPWGGEKITLPIFYDVDPDDVKLEKTGLYSEALSKHLKWSSPEQVQQWEWALREIGGVPGVFHSKDESHPEICRSFVEALLSKLKVDSGKKNITSWTKGKHLGSGAFGSVYTAILPDGSLFAVKEVDLPEGPDPAAEKEIAILSRFQHENIVQYYGSEQDGSKLSIFMELMPLGSLENVYKDNPLEESHVSAYTKQILCGLKYLHLHNVIHRDIKCANVLVDLSGCVKLADFGLAKVATLEGSKSIVGTPHWMAPEVIKANKNSGYGLPADIWSLGCTVLEMLTRRFPYPSQERQQAMFRTCCGKSPPVPDTLSDDARDFIRKCLQGTPGDRPTAAQLLGHPFVTSTSSPLR